MANQITNKQAALEGVRVGFKNFSGEPSKFNPAGKRSFNVFLDDDTAKQMEDFGYNVKWPEVDETKDPEEQFQREPRLEVKVNVDNFPPRFVIVNGAGDNPEIIEPQECDIFDQLTLDASDVVIRPYHWEMVDPKTKEINRGTAAYLSALYATVDKNPFDEKYGL